MKMMKNDFLNKNYTGHGEQHIPIIRVHSVIKMCKYPNTTVCKFLNNEKDRYLFIVRISENTSFLN